MSFLNDVKYIDLSVMIGGYIKIEGDYEDFKDIIFNSLEVGSTYNINLLCNGVPLLIKGKNVATLVFTIPERSNSFSIGFLRPMLEEFIRESDLVKDLYKENNLKTLWDSVSLNNIEEYDLYMSLVCIKIGL